jgi:hypothetical protein
MQGCGNGLAPNLFAVTKSARTDSGSESYEHVGVLLSRRTKEELLKLKREHQADQLRQWVGSRLTVHRGMGNFCPRSVDITCELISDGSVTSCHDGICGKSERGKAELNEARNGVSDEDGVPRALPWWKSLKERDAVSGKRLSEPA